MTSDQICPLCEKEMYYDSDDDLYECQSEACFLYAQEFFESDLEVLASQITRIKQQAFEEGQKSVERHTQERIAKLEKENKELLETLQSVLFQACESRAATDTEPPEYDSMALSAYADGLRLLSKYKRFRIHDESGRRVIGYMR